MAIFPLTPDQTIAQMWSNGVGGDAEFWHCHFCASRLVSQSTTCRKEQHMSWI